MCLRTFIRLRSRLGLQAKPWTGRALAAQNAAATIRSLGFDPIAVWGCCFDSRP